MNLPSLRVVLRLLHLGAGGQEFPLGLVEVVTVVVQPLFRRLQAAAPIKLAPVTSTGQPRTRRFGQVTMDSQSVSILLEPGLKPRPLADQGLVGDFDGWFTGRGIGVEGEESGLSVAVDDGFGGIVGTELGAQGAATGVHGPITRRYQSLEKRPNSGLLFEAGF